VLQDYRIIQIDARYNDEKRLKEIQDQANIILFERRIRTLFLVIFIFTLLLVTVLFIGLVKHKRGMH
jgi:hypothetical protein